MPAPKPFDPRFPRLPKVRHSDRYGRIELLSLSVTSDGFLLGWAQIGGGKNAFNHSVFLGQAEKWR